jgi:hypothetical protein
VHGIGKKVTTAIKDILSNKLFCIVFDGDYLVDQNLFLASEEKV